MAPRLAESIAHIFLWKYGKSVENKGKIFSGRVKGGIMAVFAFLGAVRPATLGICISASSSVILAANGGKFTTFSLP